MYDIRHVNKNYTLQLFCTSQLVPIDNGLQQEQAIETIENNLKVTSMIIINICMMYNVHI